MNVRIDASGARDRPGDVPPVSFRRRPRKIDIGAVDRKAGDDLIDRALQERARQIRRHRTLGQPDRAGPPTQSVVFARHFIFHDPELAVARDCLEVLVRSGKGAIDLREGLLGLGIHQRSGATGW